MLVDGTISSYGVIFNGMQKDPYFGQANFTESQLSLPGAIQACLMVTSSEFCFFSTFYFSPCLA
ncbi:unnamed protein product [Dibothriocephalus latus]|uniref:Uncharacterized protein n=1 Tax=Dibothriocephalus latus TaxID=60516 RepID=A0A3P6V0E9_DIBLA|nr:unnamed protein product [Dibothriocephalus latus]